MIIPINEAVLIDESIDQDDLDAIEVEIRNATNNNFQNVHIRYEDITFIDHHVIGVDSKVVGLKASDTVQINYSGYNDGLYVIESLTGDTIVFKDNSFTEIDLECAMLTKVEYPPDVKRGVKKIIAHDKASKGKAGIKSESIARMSVTYLENYPQEILSFLSRHEKMRW